MNHSRIIHIGNIGNIGPHLVNELRRRGYDALSVGYGRTDWPHALIPTDLQFQSKNWMEFYSVVRKLSEDYQIVHIHYCHVSPSATAILLKLLHHKIVVMHAHGNDVRFSLGRATPVRNLAMRLADRVIASTPDLLDHIPRNKAEFLGQPVDLDTFKLTPSDLYAKLHDGVEFVLFHPVDPKNKYTTWIKGTHHVLEAMKRLEKEYSLRLIMTRNILYSDMPKFYSAVDVVLDQFFYGSLTNVALETMACERPLVTDFRYYESYTVKPPCLVARSGDKIHDAVASILDDKSLRFRLGREGREFVSAEHSIQHITDRLLIIYHRILCRVASLEA